MKKIEIQTEFNIPLERAWAEIQKPELLEYVSHGILDFKPVEPPQFPDKWIEGAYEVAMYFKGIVPLGHQTIDIEFPPSVEPVRMLRDNGRGAVVKTWDHWVLMEPTEDGVRYTDRILINAGILTPFVVLFAWNFYKHRQRRWHQLIENDFNY